MIVCQEMAIELKLPNQILWSCNAKTGVLNLTLVGVNRGLHPQVLTLTHL